MSKLKSWLKKAVVSAIDPNKELRVQQIERLIVHGMNEQKDGFSLSRIALPADCTDADLQEAKDKIIYDAFGRAWADNVLTKKEVQQLNWMIKKLGVSQTQVKEIQTTFVKTAFESVLADAMQDGQIDENEEKHLNHIASQLGLTASEYAKQFFRKECEGFLRGVFLAAVYDGDFSEQEWSNLVAATAKLGIEKKELISIIQTQAQEFVEHVLADAKSDGQISVEEEQKLTWLMKTLGVKGKIKKYVESEILKLRLIQQIDEGTLPSISPPDAIEFLGGELIHAHNVCVWRQTKQLQSGPKIVLHVGTLTITDRRTLFISDTKSFRLNHRSVLSHCGGINQMEIQVSGKPLVDLIFPDGDDFAYPIFQTAIALANQTRVSSAKKDRHISRDVRQLIWQRYGGRCAECNANDYLEFDHIIPVAKGGSNSEANIQLLCRRCNLKKSDKI